MERKARPSKPEDEEGVQPGLYRALGVVVAGDEAQDDVVRQGDAGRGEVAPEDVVPAPRVLAARRVVHDFHPARARVVVGLDLQPVDPALVGEVEVVVVLDDRVRAREVQGRREDTHPAVVDVRVA